MAGQDLRPAYADALSAFGVPVTVTRPAPDDDPITTVGIWLPPVPTDAPFGMDLQRQDPKKVIGIPLADVPTLPRGSLIEAPEELGGTVLRWRTDGEALRFVDEVRAVVIPAEPES